MTIDLFPDPDKVRAEIAARIAKTFPCYGEGSAGAPSDNPVAATLAKQPAQFAFGVSVRDVVNQVIDLYEQR